MVRYARLVRYAGSPQLVVYADLQRLLRFKS
jgi:hypothetical protein